MPHIRRGPDGQIESIHRHGAPGMEFVPDGHAELMTFLGHSAPQQSDFGRLDADFVRVIEDVIDTLIIKNLINITDLPGEAQAKLFARKNFRDRISKNSLRLFVDTGFNSLIDDTNFTDL